MYIVIETCKDTFLRKVNVELEQTIGDFLRCELIDNSNIESVYKINSQNGEVEILYEKTEIIMSLSEVEDKLGLTPVCLNIKPRYAHTK